MRERVRAFRDAFAGRRALFCYAVKANSNLAVIRLFAAEGLGADTVSGGEIARALAAGVPPRRIVYAGIAKTDDEIRMALAAGILQFNVEFGAGAAPDRRAGARPWAARRRWRCGSIRTSTPARTRRSAPAASTTSSASPTTRRPTSTGWRPGSQGIEPVGLHLHIGSQITRLEPFEAAYRRGAELFTSLRAAGHPAAPARPRRRLRRALPRRAAGRGRRRWRRWSAASPRALGLRAAVRARPRARRRGGCHPVAR